MDNIKIRTMKKEEYDVLEDFLYEAIFIPEGAEKPSKDIIKNKDLQVYINKFGAEKDDNCLVAEYNNKIVGTKSIGNGRT